MAPELLDMKQEDTIDGKIADVNSNATTANNNVVTYINTQIGSVNSNVTTANTNMKTYVDNQISTTVSDTNAAIKSNVSSIN